MDGSEPIRRVSGGAITVAVKEAACAKLSIPWRPNLGIQRSWLSRGDQQGGIQVGIVGSGSYEQSWRAIPTQRPGPRDMYPVLSGNLQELSGQGRSK